VDVSDSVGHAAERQDQSFPRRSSAQSGVFAGPAPLPRELLCEKAGERVLSAFGDGGDGSHYDFGCAGPER